ncbi:M1 family metallopeptidase [Catalinimonas sp. 4WD22]|uniref:M1 family metallopeptidase n=1 Tax=Catalinimonas locisalis TaxID=3133978 RepID=UPI0031017323
MRNTHTILFGIISLLFVGNILPVQAQSGYWQQGVEYTMEVDMDVETHQFTGTQNLVYYNNSPDTLHQVFYHLYFNAFQPGSMMDVRSRTIEDPDSRVRDRILYLGEDEIGYQRIESLQQDGDDVEYEMVGTILEVKLNEPIMPNSEATFDMVFEGQVPLQVRRTGRDNEEGIDYSMAQWYPKMAEYDYEGWHANPYIGREFHGVWGSYDVKISIDSSYVMAATGYLQNPQEIGHGYQEEGKRVRRPNSNKLTYHFTADNVHDFMWAADPDYVHTIAQVPDGPTVHFFYQQDSLTQNWNVLPEYTVKAFQYMNEHFGKYPYDKYSVVQGGDGGMEYPMATLITGHRSLRSLVGVTVHEMIHSWYQGVLGTNESLYPWMDEGFTSYASSRTMANIFGGNPDDPQVHANSYAGYFNLAESGREEPMTTHSDHYSTNFAYGRAAYSKGAVFLAQLSYIIGDEVFERGMKRYFEEWKFKHPNPTNLKRIMEKESSIELDWYFEYFVNTTHTIDYGVKSVEDRGATTHVTLERVDKMPMPLDVLVTYEGGEQELFYIPLRIMRGEKENDTDYERTVLKDWPWVFPTYLLQIPRPLDEISQIQIDPSYRMADIDRSNNTYPDMGNTRFGEEAE